MVSFDFVSLYTNVPVMESIKVCADLLFRENVEKPPVDRETFIELAKIASCNVILSAHNGYYQVDDLAMGSPPAPHIANGWLSQFDNAIQGNAKMFSRYMDDIIREIKKDDIDDKLVQSNNLHPNLAFTIEKKVKSKLPFLDMLIIHKGEKVSSTWFTKATDTGLILKE